MERLTEKHYLGTDHYMKCSGNCNVDMDCIDCPSFDRLVERLAAYEDTGLTPESVEAIKLHMMGKAISEITEFNGLQIDRLRELAEADKEGRVVVLPVKPVLTPIISSMLYIIDDGDIYEDALYEADVGMSESGKTNVVYTTLSDLMIFEQADIGKTVFLTREEAEKALEVMRDGDKESV